MDSLSTYATREEGNFSDNGRTLPSVSTVSDSAATTFYAEESNTTSNDTGLLQGTTEMFANSAYFKAENTNTSGAYVIHTLLKLRTLMTFLHLSTKILSPVCGNFYTGS